jgi:hypothetical protein
MKRLLLLIPVFALLHFTGPASGQNPYTLQINMYGEQSVPPVDSPAWGFVRFFFNEDRTRADYTVDLKGYSNSVVLGADIHRGAPGQNGPVVIHLADADFIVTSGRLELTRAQVEEFASGNWYVTIKTTFYPEGEIRGQILVPPNFLPGAPAPLPTPTPQTPPAAGGGAPAAPPPGSISPPNTGSAGLQPGHD